MSVNVVAPDRGLGAIHAGYRSVSIGEYDQLWGVMLCVDSGTCGKDLGYVYAPTPPRVLC